MTKIINRYKLVNIKGFYIFAIENNEKEDEEDEKSSFFSTKMNTKIILSLVDEALQENEALFVVDLKISETNKITLILDGDQGISLSECIRVTKFIENHLDREEEDYSLEVSSPDIAEPLKNIRQYNKNINRILKVKTENEKFEGTLTKVSNNEITLTWKAREPKPIGKGKITVEKKAVIAFKDIKQTKVKIIF